MSYRRLTPVTTIGVFANLLLWGYQMLAAPVSITIDVSKELHALQTEFSAAYPYLKLRFLSDANGAIGERNVLRHKSLDNAAALTITPDMTIATLKQNLCAAFGWPVQVMRRFGNTWIETTVTDGWTLAEQNKHGERLASKRGEE